ncbi:hypothetical protein O181_013630 [Austropuccinia psidii MF-1]|uniref:Uncharacterized protein n=1 Tax=Austropuccinia psidii MF-1 TaxID=1389203 RepID=A0A9Q3BZE0_9BASI|nr:hypothetical protein [Austropuccinia psidii MF-1]
MLRWQIAIKEVIGNMTIIYKEFKSHPNAYVLFIWLLHNLKVNSSYDPEVALKICIHVMEVDGKKNFRFSELAPEIATLDTGNDEPEETETHILGISSSDINTKFFNAVH